VYDRTLPGHPCRQSSNLVDVYVRRVTNAALGWTSRKIVLHSEALENLNSTRIHSSWDIDLELAVRNPHHRVEIRIEIQQLCRSIKTRHHRLERIVFFNLPDVVNECCRHELLPNRADLIRRTW